MFSKFPSQSTKQRFMRILVLCFILIIIIFSTNFAQNSLKGKIIDFDTKNPVPCAQISLWGDVDADTVTNSDGEFMFENLEEGEYTIYINHNNYNSTDEDIEIKSGLNKYEKAIYSYDSDSFYIQDLAAEDIFDIGTFTLFFNPTMKNFDRNFTSGYPIVLYNLEPKFRINDIQQIGLRFSLFELNWLKFNDNVSITTNANIKERYFSISGSAFIYNRFLITTEETGGRGLFFDLGAGYKIPYYYAYTYLTDDFTKTTTKKINNYNDFEAMARIGYSWVAILATYRFNDNLKTGYIQPPNLNIGFEFLIPTY